MEDEDHDEREDRDSLKDGLRELRRKLRDRKYVRRLKILKAIDEDRRAEHDKAAKEFRTVLRSQGLLPPEFDDFGNLLRYMVVLHKDVLNGRLRRDSSMHLFHFLWPLTELRLAG